MKLNAFVYSVSVTVCVLGASAFSQPLAPRSGETNLSQSSRDPRLKQAVKMEGAMRPISKLLDVVQGYTGCPTAVTDDIPDVRVFCAGADEGAVWMRQLQRVLSDKDYQYFWGTRPAEGGTYYWLWRQAADPKKRSSDPARRSKARLSELLGLIRSGDQGMQQLIKENPMLAATLRQPARQARLELLGRLPVATLNGVLSGRALQLPVRTLSPQDRALVFKAVGNNGMVTSTDDATGKTTVLFDRNQMADGYVTIEATEGYQPGANGINMRFNTGDPRAAGYGGAGGEVLWPEASIKPSVKEVSPETKNEATAVLKKGARAVEVTIDKDTMPRKDEPRIAAYLRVFAQQTGLTVLGRWPETTPRMNEPLSASIVKRPYSEALDTLSELTGCEWTQEERVVLIRYKKPPAPKT
jgi:hypothetical protein